MGIHHVGRARSSEDATHRATIVERVDRHRVQEPCEPGLPSPVAPDLSDHRLGGVQRRSVAERCCEELSGGTFATVDRDEEPGVKNQGRSARSSLQPHRRSPDRRRAPSRAALPRARSAVVSHRPVVEDPGEARSTDRHESLRADRVCAPRRGRGARLSSTRRLV